MFESLSDKISLAFKHLKGNAHLTELNIAAAVKDIRKALLDADVHYKIAKEFTDKVKQRAIGEKVIGALRPEQVMVKIMQDELTQLLGGTHYFPAFKGAPCVILVAGLQGAGKTTFCAKLAKYLRETQQLRPMLVAADVYRPAAVEQLKVLAAQTDTPVYAEEGKEVVGIVQRALSEAKAQKINVMIVDTAGRLSVDKQMMEEIQQIKAAVQPQETLFVLDAMVGQDAVHTAKVFHEYLDLSGVVLSKLDGDTRGGAAFSVKYLLNKPIVFMSNGEKLSDLTHFYPDRLAGRILGMGDIASLVERAEALFNQEQTKKLERKIKKNKFDFEDFLEQLRTIKKMGNMKDLLAMVPGMGAQLKDMPLDERQFIGIEAMILSMTPRERRQPELIDASRKQRIAKGSGKTVQELSRFLKQFEQMKKMMQNMGRMERMMPSFLRR